MPTEKRQQKKCPIVNQVVQLYVQMVLLPDLTGLIVFSVKTKVIKKRWHAFVAVIKCKKVYLIQHFNCFRIRK
jgi:hypothetical protein